MFQHLKNIDGAFRHVRLFTFVVIAACMAICCYTVYESYRMVSRANGSIYLLANGKALQAFAAERKDNIAVEARDHIKMFHHYFFSLDPDDKVIDDHIRQALYLADGTAQKQYADLKENGYYAGIISGNISQQISADSITVDLDSYPYPFRYYGKQKIVRPSAIVERTLVSEGYLRSVSRSDNNAHGFLIEKWRILDNKDLSNKNR